MLATDIQDPYLKTTKVPPLFKEEYITAPFAFLKVQWASTNGDTCHTASKAVMVIFGG